MLINTDRSQVAITVILEIQYIKHITIRAIKLLHCSFEMMN
jgi:hypothetical protein